MTVKWTPEGMYAGISLYIGHMRYARMYHDVEERKFEMFFVGNPMDPQTIPGEPSSLAEAKKIAEQTVLAHLVKATEALTDHLTPRSALS